jgi:dipeptidyl aminopeptidase/acylaminoacyl peptidase
MRVSLLGAALLISLAAVGCGGTNVDINQNGGGHALVSWGKPAGGNPKGVVILLHGGGWQPSRDGYEAEMPTAAQLQQLGYATVVIGYDAGATGFQEIRRVYSQVRRRYHGLPTCVHGFSAGGNLGLMLAAREPGINCVLGIAAPTDLTALRQQGGTEAHDLAARAFGEDQLSNWSPVHYAGQIKAKVLLIAAQDDPVVPIAQAREFAHALPRTQVDVIPAGSTPLVWLHGAKVNPEAAQAAIQQGFTFLTQELNGG